ncbi:olfactory receptor 51I2-like [Acipenser ruthenus]|uniref:olfactory receptor 51I2-like n=1 Tax=Acipenser ruthenus TaxID=7906 RepID=UPI002741E892|nr:olfactory receptor 51I2-like [Acipenser ruthenus]
MATQQEPEDLSNFTHPVGFYIRGFYALQNTDYYFIFLSVVYVVTLLANFLIMSIIWYAESLHTSKYLAIFSLAVVDVSYSTALIPKAIHTFLFNSRFVYFDACLTQIFFVHYFCSMESFALCVLAYDRLIAIYFPLRSNTLNSTTRMMLVILISWIIPLIVVVIMVALIPRLSYCKTTIVNSYFCDHGPVFKIACGDYSPNWFMACFYTVGLFFAPFAFIVLTYMFIVRALLKIASAEGRWKAFKTCSTHLTLVDIFYIPILVTYVVAWVNVHIDTDTRIINTSLSATIPPLLNPIIYTLKTEEIMEQIKKLIKNRKISSING